MSKQQTLFGLDPPGLTPAEWTELMADWEALDEAIQRWEQRGQIDKHLECEAKTA